MQLYEGILVKQDNKFLAAILRLNSEEPNCDTVAEREFDREDEANSWLDREMSRFTEDREV